jgi:hypothetical protein
MRAIAILCATVAAARAAPVDPAKLAPIAASTKGTGEAATVYAAGVDADMLLYALGADDFAMVTGARPIEGRLGDTTTVPASAAFDALATGLDVIRLHRSRGAHAVDLDLHHARALEVLQLAVDVAGASSVIAPQHELPLVTVRVRKGDPREIARAVAKLVGLELIESHGVWVFAEPGTKLDDKVAATTHARSRLAIDHAHPGEARRLLEPDVPQDRNACPPNTWIDANLHGQTGVLEAVLATISGPPCEQQPNTTELDTATATLVGILVEANVRRAVFRVPHGARAFEPRSGEQRVEISYVRLEGDKTATLRTTPAAPGTPPGPFAADDPHAWRLRGTVRVGKQWRALFRSGTDWRVVAGTEAEITATTVAVKPRAYALER